MPRKWKDYRSWEAHERRSDRLQKQERIKRSQRSNRGRSVDDWILNPNPRDDSWKEKETELINSGCLRGRVIEVHKRGAFVAEEPDAAEAKPGARSLKTELVWFCSIAKRHFQRSHKERNFVVVGDRVLLEPDSLTSEEPSSETEESDLPRGVIQHCYARTSKVARRDPLHREWEHVMLANVDQLAIVASVMNPQVRWGLIDRFLVQAEMENLPAFVILNKVDLLELNPVSGRPADPAFVEQYHRRVEIYRSIGYRVFELSALNPGDHQQTCATVRDLFRSKLTGLCGHSGVGKSSVINLLDPEIVQEVDADPEIFYKGRHTTTYNSLLRLGIGGFAIDTPGIRSFSLEELDAITLSSCFPEFAPHKCRFRECRHYKEQECAIKAAVSRGEISQERYRSYLGLLLGVSEREGEGDATHAELIADLKARQQSVEESLRDSASSRDEGEGE